MNIIFLTLSRISNIEEREEFRKFSYVSLVAKKTIFGKGFDGYIDAMEYLLETI